MSRIHPCDRANFRTVDDGLHTQLAVRDQGASFSPMSAIGTKQTSASAPHMSAFDPTRTSLLLLLRLYALPRKIKTIPINIIANTDVTAIVLLFDFSGSAAI
jgi:hypothetical protein